MTPHHENQGGRHAPWIRRVPWVRLFAEFGVIFLGITLSLLADDWRQSRTDREDERQALQELLDDLRADWEDLDSLRFDLARHDRDGVWLFRRLGQPGVIADSAAARIGSLHELNVYKAPRATYTGLRSSGRLVLIHDQGLRREIIRYYEERQPYLLQFKESYGRLWNDFTDAIALDAEVFYPNGIGETFFSGIAFRLRRPWADVPTDPQLRYKLSTMGILAGLMVIRITEVLEENEAIQAAIQRALEP